MKQILDLRPVHHRLSGRIRAHVLLCWLALLLIRSVETTTGDTWTTTRRELQRLHVGHFTGPYRQTTVLTAGAAEHSRRLDVMPPPRILELATAAG
ncbi:hypothetical protein [Rhodococcus aetherivorans]